MPRKKPSDRIAALKSFIKDKQSRLDNLKSVQKIRARIEAATKEAELMEVAEAERKKTEEAEAVKLAADQRRKDDQRAKIIWGAGLRLLDPNESARIQAQILKVLSARDQKWMTGYSEKYRIALSASISDEPILQSQDALSIPAEKPDPTAEAIMRAIERFDMMTLAHVEGEFLTSSQSEDRGLLEVFFANLGKRSGSNDPK